MDCSHFVQFSLEPVKLLFLATKAQWVDHTRRTRELASIQHTGSTSRKSAPEKCEQARKRVNWKIIQSFNLFWLFTAAGPDITLRNKIFNQNRYFFTKQLRYILPIIFIFRCDHIIRCCCKLWHIIWWRLQIKAVLGTIPRRTRRVHL